ncbi:hypothetical protein WP50_05940 [Lactiplantibacillus plantarum]|nr:hypothetical protein WP50_05940 [Lactiplantibacillus plantarum]
MIYSLGLMLGVGVIAGIFGAILGIGGGMIVTPILTLGLGLDIKYAIGASIIAVIATSRGRGRSDDSGRQTLARGAATTELSD